jgi:methyl-accepting chemotaxis protein
MLITINILFSNLWFFTVDPLFECEAAMTIRARLYSAFFMILFLVSLMGGISLHLNSRVREEHHRINEILSAKQQLTERETDHFKWVSGLQNSLLNHSSSVGVQLNPKLCKLGKFLYGEGLKELKTFSANTYRIIQGLEQPHENLHESGHAIEALLLNTDKTAGIADATRHFKNHTLKYLAQVQKVIRDAEAQRNNDAAAAIKTTKEIEDFQNNLTIGIVLAVLLICLIVGYSLSRLITNGLDECIEFAGEVASGNVNLVLKSNRTDEIGHLFEALNSMVSQLKSHAQSASSIAKGNLDIKVKISSPKDSFGESLRQMVISLSQLIGTVKSTAAVVNKDSQNLDKTSASMSHSASETAASIEQISASLVEVSTQVEHTAASSRQASNIAEHTRELEPVVTSETKDYSISSTVPI